MQSAVIVKSMVYCIMTRVYHCLNLLLICFKGLDFVKGNFHVYGHPIIVLDSIFVLIRAILTCEQTTLRKPV